MHLRKKHLWERVFLLSTAILLLKTHTVSAQKAVHVWATEAGIGHVLPHSPELAGISVRPPFFWMLEWTRIKATEASWQNCACYAKTGASLSLTDFGNPAEMGRAYTLALLGEPHLGLSDKLFVTLRGSIGMVYLDRVYDPVANPRNLFYSSPLSFSMQAGSHVNFKPGNRWVFRGGLLYNHISNGGIRLPNKGVNYPVAVLGASYLSGPLRLEKGSADWERQRAWPRYLRLFATVSNPGEGHNNGKLALLAGIGAGIQRRVGRINALSTGLEAMYAGHLRSPETAHPGVLAWMFGHHFVFGRFGFSQQMGVRLLRPANETYRLYQRYEVSWQLNKNLLVGTSLKTHAQIGRNIDIRLGYVW